MSKLNYKNPKNSKNIKNDRKNGSKPTLFQVIISVLVASHATPPLKGERAGPDRRSGANLQ